MKNPLVLITINIIIITTLPIFFELVFAVENYVNFIIKKPEWCNSTNLVYYYTILEIQKEYKYPCASFIDKNI
ncbi:MAG TPA: hypothetical protein VJ583_05740 [Nitrososphaeraceae archaeon]|nr:hypothetical protein [Nitrososphaeraceae archaeon]